MTLLHWRPNMSIGVDAIDSDHRLLIDLLNRLHLMMRAGDEQQAIESVLQDLLHYVQRHFRREEALMRRSAFPGLEAHAACHRELADALRTWNHDYHQDHDRFDVAGFYDFVSDWLLVHVLEEDMKLRRHLRRNAPEGRQPSRSLGVARSFVSI